jgi:hypothetical protein
MKELKQTLDNLGFETLPMMTQFIYDLNEHTYDDDDRFSNETLSYRNFITQPLTLSQFVACKNGVPMEEPKKEDFHLEVTREQGGENEVTTEFREDYFNEAIEEYQKAVDAVIFEGCDDNYPVKTPKPYLRVLLAHKTIESFINNGGKLKLK